MSGKRLGFFIFIALLATLAIWQWDNWLGQDDRDQPLRLYGNIEIREVNLSFRVAGRLDQMLVEEGDTIQAGDPMARLETTPLQEAMDVASARLAEAQARLKLLETGSRPQEVEQAQATLYDARVALAETKTDLMRQQHLFAAKTIAQARLDKATTAYEQSKAGVIKAEQSLALVKEGFRSEDIEAADASVAGAKAGLAQAKTQFKDALLAAPSNGVVISRLREPGAIVAIGEPVYTLSLTERLYVRAYVDEPNLGEVKPGRAVTIHTDSSEDPISGHIGFVSPRAEFTPKTVETPTLRTDLVYRLRIIVDETNDQLRQGMPVTIALENLE